MEAWDAKASGLPVAPYSTGTERRGPQPTIDGKRPCFPIRRSPDQDRRWPRFFGWRLVAADAFPDEDKNFRESYLQTGRDWRLSFANWVCAQCSLYELHAGGRNDLLNAVAFGDPHSLV